ncbi:hypothetical protein [Enterococcus italicus]|uniref:hypothetical protein n=1 Tax=Enterococcus italicus TaxID=246144 RepID=UPI0020742209|nr:hypothetical protein [Enterococcus italicus]
MNKLKLKTDIKKIKNRMQLKYSNEFEVMLGVELYLYGVKRIMEFDESVLYIVSPERVSEPMKRRALTEYNQNKNISSQTIEKMYEEYRS